MFNNQKRANASAKRAGLGAAEYAVFIVGALVVAMFVFATIQLGNF